MDTLRVIYHAEPEGWWAESPDLDGWYAAAESYEELRALADAHVRYALNEFGLAAEAVDVEHFVPAPA